MAKRKKPGYRTLGRVGRVALCQFERGGPVYGRWVDGSGRRCSQKLGDTERAAKRAAKAVDVAIDKGALGNHPVDPSRRALASLLEEYQEELERSGGDKHVTDVLCVLQKAFVHAGAARVDDVTADRMERYLDGVMKAGSAAETANHHRTYILGFWRWAYETDRILVNPVKRLQKREGAKRRKRQANSPRQIAALLKAASCGRPYEYDACVIAYGSGMRQGEIRRLRWGDLDLGARLYRFTGDRQKGGKDTVTALHTDVIGFLRRLKKQRERSLGRGVEPDELVVRGIPSCPKALASHRRATVKRAGIPYRDLHGAVCDWHSMRHTYITRLGDCDSMDLKTKSLLARHSDTETTSEYDHVDLHRQHRALAKVSRVLPSAARRGA